MSSHRSERFPSWLPYVLPYVLFGVATWLGSLLPGHAYVGYVLRVLLAGGALWYFWRAGCYPELSLRPTVLGILAGLAGYALWVLPEQILAPLPRLGGSHFDADSVDAAWRTPYVLWRWAGSVLVVPIFEELFLRSFLVRYLDALRTDHGDFRRLPIGQFRWLSFLGVVAAMAVSHDRWLRGGLYSALMLLVLYREKSMGGVIWAHAVTNLCLGAHVVVFDAWHFW